MCITLFPDAHDEQYKVCTKIFEGIDEKFKASSLMCEQLLSAIDEKIKVANHRICDLEIEGTDMSKRLSAIDTIVTSTLAKLTLLSEQNIETNKIRDEELKSHRDTLIQISNTLINMNKKLEEGDLRVDDLEDKIAERMKDSDKKFVDLDRRDKISISDTIKYGIIIAISTGIGVIATKIFEAITIYLTK